MIPTRSARYTMAVISAAAFAAAATVARADVMEVGPEGARWVAGELAQPNRGDEDSAANGLVYSALTVPDTAVSDVVSSAAAVPAQYIAKIKELSQRFDLSPSLLEAVVWQESRWRAGAVNEAGARGLAQLMPGTAVYLGVDPDNPMENLEGGARYLREQLDRFDGDLEKALAAYNAGPGRVIRADGVPNIRETKLYVAAILGRLANHSRPEVAP